MAASPTHDSIADIQNTSAELVQSYAQTYKDCAKHQMTVKTILVDLLILLLGKEHHAEEEDSGLETTHRTLKALQKTIQQIVRDGIQTTEQISEALVLLEQRLVMRSKVRSKYDSGISTGSRISSISEEDLNKYDDLYKTTEIATNELLRRFTKQNETHESRPQSLISSDDPSVQSISSAGSEEDNEKMGSRPSSMHGISQPTGSPSTRQFGAESSSSGEKVENTATQDERSKLNNLSPVRFERTSQTVQEHTASAPQVTQGASGRVSSAFPLPQQEKKFLEKQGDIVIRRHQSSQSRAGFTRERQREGTVKTDQDLQKNEVKVKHGTSSKTDVAETSEQCEKANQNLHKADINANRTASSGTEEVKGCEHGAKDDTLDHQLDGTDAAHKQSLGLESDTIAKEIAVVAAGHQRHQQEENVTSVQTAATDDGKVAEASTDNN